MNVIDLRKLGPITAEGELYLATLIRGDPVNPPLKDLTKGVNGVSPYFGWDNCHLGVYVLANLMTKSSTRVQGFISSGEWLCGVFTSGPFLSVEHLLILMSYINPYVSNQMISSHQYQSGKDAWSTAAAPIKEILNLLDDAIVNGQPVHVKIPIAVPIDPSQSIETIEYLRFEELLKYVKIVWPEQEQQNLDPLKHSNSLTLD